MQSIMDGDDEIVEEIPVYLTKTLKDNLFIFQYPSHPFVTKGRDFRNSIENCYVKPINEQVKFQLPLNTDPMFYNRKKGEHLATPGNASKYERLSKRNFMDKQDFISAPSSNDASRLLVAVYANKEIHLTPLKSILKMRPSFEHMEKVQKRKKSQQKKNNADGDDDSSDLQQVKVKFAHSGLLTNSASKGERHENSIKNGLGEPWFKGMWYTSDTEEAKLERKKLFGDIRQKVGSLHLRPTKYAKVLLPTAEECMHIDTIIKPKVFCRTRITPLSIMDQLKVLLKDAGMLYFEEIMSFFRSYVNPEMSVNKILRLLSQVGLLMNGVWVAQSDVVYPNDIYSYPNGVKPEVMQRARDYILYYLYRDKCVYRKYILSGTRLPTTEAMQVLKSVAHRNGNKWELLLPPDKQFEEKYPDLVQRQVMIWRATENIYIEMNNERKQYYKSKSLSESLDTATSTSN